MSFDIIVNTHLVHQTMFLLFCFSADEDIIALVELSVNNYILYYV